MKKQFLKDARVSQRIDSQLDASLKIVAKKLNLRRAEIIRQALSHYLDLQGFAGSSSSEELEVKPRSKQ